jgi:phosphoglycerate dehydrogenase-like enzyme
VPSSATTVRDRFDEHRLCPVGVFGHVPGAGLEGPAETTPVGPADHEESATAAGGGSYNRRAREPVSMSATPTLLLTHRRSKEFVDAFRTALTERLGHDPVERTQTPAETREAFESASAVVTNPLRDDWLGGAGNLEWVQTVSAGVDHLPHDRLREQGVTLTNASGIHAQPIAEQVLGYMLTFERNLHVAQRQQRRRVWEGIRGGELHGKRLCVVGLGAIGSRIAQVGDAIGMSVVGTKRDPSDGPAVADVHPPDELHELLTDADYLVLACPLTDETEGLIGTAELELLDSEAVLINIARGEVVDEAALTSALRSHRIGGAALDVFETEPLPEESPLWTLSNTIITPHMAGSNPHSARRLADIVADNYRAFADGEVDEMRNRVY